MLKNPRISAGFRRNRGLNHRENRNYLGITGNSHADRFAQDCAAHQHTRKSVEIFENRREIDAATVPVDAGSRAPL
jgi:hypothetical protein